MKLSRHFFWQLTLAWCVSFFFFLSFFLYTLLIFFRPQTGLTEPRRGSRGEVQAACQSEMSISNPVSLDEGGFLFSQTEINKRLGFTLMGETNRSSGALHSGDNSLYRGSQQVTFSVYCGQSERGSVWWAGVSHHLEAQQRAGSEEPLPLVCMQIRLHDNAIYLYTRCWVVGLSIHAGSLKRKLPSEAIWVFNTGWRMSVFGTRGGVRGNTVAR